MGRVFLLSLIAFVPFNAFGQPYPNKPIRLIVPYVAGGATDVLAREVALRLQSELGVVHPSFSALTPCHQFFRF